MSHFRHGIGLRLAFPLGPTLAVFLITASPGLAEEGTSGYSADDLKKLSLEQLMEVEVPTVYGASKHVQSVSEAPASISIVTSDDFKKYGYRNLAEALRSVPGFYTTYNRTYSMIGVRGFNRPGDWGGRVLVLVDGHRLNEPLYDSAFNGLDFPVDVDLIDRVEVVRGPGFSLYGNNAFLAVINVVTRQGHDLRGAELSGAAASYDSYSGRVSYGNRLKNGLEFLFSGTLYDSGGHDRLFYPEFCNVNGGVAEHMDNENAQKYFVSARYGDLSLRAAYGSRLKRDPTACGVDTVFNDRRTRVEDDRGYVDLKFEREVGDDWQIMARMGLDYYRYEGNYPYDSGDPDTSPSTILNLDQGKALWWGGEFQVSRTFLEQHHVSLGTEFKDELDCRLHNFDESPGYTYFDGSSDVTDVGVYLQDEYSVLTNLILTAAVRYDYWSSVDGKVNFRGGVIYSPWKPTTLKFIYGQGYRVPNAYEQYFVAYGYKSNPDLAPEDIRSYELIWEQRLAKRFRLSASLFYDDIQDLIGQALDPADDLFFYQNVDAVEVIGTELSLEGRWANGLRGLASYTYADARDSITREHLSNSPRHLAKLNLTAPVYAEKVFAGLELQATGERATGRGSQLPSFVVVNATLFSRELIKNLELSISLYNLFDWRYSDPVSDDYAQEAIEQDGRSFRVKLTYRF